MHQTHHSVRDRHRHPGTHQRPFPGRQFDVVSAVEIDARIAVMGTAGQRQIAVQSYYRQRGGHDVTDYS